MRTGSLHLLLTLLALSACGGTTESGGTTSSSSSGATGSGGGSGGGGGGGSGIQCQAQPPAFPTFDKSCDSPAACVVKLHQINCCGTRIAIGVSLSASSAFDQAEVTCEAMYPQCGCAQQPTRAEDGKEAVDESMIKVDCKTGECSTYLP